MSARLAVLLVCLLAPGCGFLLDTPRVENRCGSDTDCPGARCDVAAGRCVSSSPTRLMVGIEVERSSLDGVGGSVAPFEVAGPVTTSCAEAVTGPTCIGLPRLIVVGTTVRAPGFDGPVPAQVAFARAAVIPGRYSESVLTATQSIATTQNLEAPADAIAQLEPEATYAVTVRPLGEAAARLPPLRVPEAFVPRRAGEVLAVRYPDVFSHVRGVVSDGSDVPQAGLAVRAVALDGSTVSTTVTTGADGAFDLALSPDAVAYQLRFTAAAATTLVPSFVVDPRYLYPDAQGVAAVRVPEPEPTVTYEGIVESAEGSTPVMGASVQLLSTRLPDRTGAQATFRPETVTTDERGRFRVQVVPGFYGVLVQPPSAAGASSASGPALGVLFRPNVEIVSATGGTTVAGQLFALPPQARLSGRVRTADGRLMSGAAVDASALGLPLAMPGEVTRYNRSTSDVTTLDGDFDLRLDLGVYDLSVRPPAESGFPWIVRPGVKIESVGALPAMDYPFPAPVPVQGAVADDRGQPIVGAEVRAFAILGPASAPRAIAIAQATTDTQGRYTLLLPPTVE